MWSLCQWFFFRILSLYLADILDHSVIIHNKASANIFDYCTLIDKAHFQVGLNGVGIVFIDRQGYLPAAGQLMCIKFQGIQAYNFCIITSGTFKKLGRNLVIVQGILLMNTKKSVFGKVDGIWETIKDFIQILKPCRFSIMLLIAILAFFVLSDQGQDVLRALTEQENTAYSRIFWFFLALFLWAVNTWYWARVMLRFNFDKQDKIITDCHPLSEQQKQRRIRIRQYLPRFLGTFAFLLCAYAFYKTGSDQSNRTGSDGYLYFTAACIVFAGLFLYLTVKRRQWINRLLGQLSAQKSWLKSLAQDFNELSSEQAYAANYTSLADVPLLTWIMLGILAAVSIILFVLFTVLPNSAVVLGTAAIFLAAAASWVCFGSFLVYAGSQYSFPVFTLLLIAAVGFSIRNNNHDIRYLENQQFASRTGLNDYSKEWFDGLNQESEQKTPYFIIAAEGGGIRAAYWTALVLSAFQDSNTEFSRHVLALSGVSGGSLGSAVFAAALHEQVEQGAFSADAVNKGLKCRLKDTDSITEASVQACTSAVLANDFLSPAVAFMLYPDLLQRFLPLPIPFFDRSRALEQSWEAAWADVFPAQNNSQSNLFAGDFFELWNIKDEHKYIIPNLFLNSTWVETGKRVISSNLLIDHRQFFDAVDFFEALNRDVRLSSAVHNSARFTYVSPAGRLQPPGKPVWGHLVDGGYFENSGATTAFNILLSINKHINNPEKYIPVVMVITNDPAVKQPCDNTENTQDPSENNCPKQEFMNELYSPVATMLNTRGARGSYARDEIKKYVRNMGGLYLEVGLCGDKGPLPLGWTLSDAAKNNMEQQLKAYLQSFKQSGENFDSLNIKHLSNLKAILNQACI